MKILCPSGYFVPLSYTATADPLPLNTVLHKLGARRRTKAVIREETSQRLATRHLIGQTRSASYEVVQYHRRQDSPHPLRCPREHPQHPDDAPPDDPSAESLAATTIPRCKAVHLFSGPNSRQAGSTNCRAVAIAISNPGYIELSYYRGDVSPHGARIFTASRSITHGRPCGSGLLCRSRTRAPRDRQTWRVPWPLPSFPEVLPNSYTRTERRPFRRAGGA